MKIGYKITLLFIFLSLAIVSAIGITLLVQARGDIKELAQDAAVSTARDYAGQFESFFSPYWYIADTAAELMEQYENIPANLRRPLFNRFIQGVVESHPEISGIWCIWEPDVLEGNDRLYLGTEGTNENGRFAPYWYREENNDVEMYALNDFEIPGEDDDYYQTAKLSGRRALLDPYTDDVAGETVLMTSVTAILYNGSTLLGVIGIDFTVDAIQEMSQSFKPFENSLTAVFSNAGIIAGHFDSSRVGEDMQETEHDLTGPYLDDFIEAVHAGKEFHYALFFDVLKTNMNVYITPINVGDAATPWSFAIAIPEKTVMTPVRKMEIITVIISAVILLLLVIPASLVMGRSLSKPIIKISEALKDISEGEGDLTRTINIHSKDEISDLALYFNHTIGNIKNMVSLIKYKVHALTNTGYELSVNMTKTSKAVDEIASHLEEIHGLEAKQHQGSVEVDKALDEIKNSIDLLNKLIDEQTDSINTSSSAIEEMTANIHSVSQTLAENSKNVGNLTDASEHGKTGLQMVAQEILEIAKESEGLLEINQVMKTIASQTNLLAMNAAIEAAHAGDAGRGFAVVADEIRKLAESSGQQSKTTAVMLKKIKASIDNITKSSNEVLERFGAIDTGVKTVSYHETNIRHAMEEQEVGGKQILESIGRLKEITVSVQKGSENMSKSGDDLFREADDFIKVSNEAISGMNEIVNGALKEIKTAVTNVIEMSSENNKNFEELKGETEKFRIATGKEKREIMAIDDDEVQLQMLRAFLEEGYEVITVKSCAEALKLLYRGINPCFILLDLMMPETDGWETYKSIHGISNLHNVPIAFLTASDDPADIDHAKEMGAADYIKKPCSKHDLLERIERILN
ncbi:MAG: methyl-accepting chemotaxis protein [Treponema sp.]|jgi:methyl-accepting chemotaxis protein|nr:methyl-accepting chemotaxis protein [Treponema sp.]